MSHPRCQNLAVALSLLAFASTALGGDAPLADAAEKSDRSGLLGLLEREAAVNQVQPDGMTALHWTVHHDDLEASKLLVAAGADATLANRYGVTPLALACLNGDEAITRLLLDAGADPNHRGPGEETALMTASRTGNPGVVKALLAKGADPKAKERRGQTPLMWAAAEGHAAVVEVLLEAGADFRTALPSGFTPLAFAVREGKTEVVRALLKAGADVNEAMQPKRTSGRSPVKGTSPLILAVENGHFELAVVLLEAGADPNDQRSGFTALHTLTWVRKPNRGDDADGDPSPIGSGRLDSLQFVEELVRHGADVNLGLTRGSSGRGVLNRSGATPFLLASKTADVPLLKLLVKLGADPKRPNVDGCTPLMAAAGVGCLAPEEEAGTEPEAIEAIKLAIQLGNDINAMDANGETVMHGAAYKSLPAVVQLLSDSGARVEVWDRKNKHGWTPLAIAEGHRPGNFKPSPETIEAIRRVMNLAKVPPTNRDSSMVPIGVSRDRTGNHGHTRPSGRIAWLLATSSRPGRMDGFLRVRPRSFPRSPSMVKLATTALVALGLMAVPALGQSGAPRPYAETRNYSQWEKEVAAYEAADRKSPPPKGGILFIGSSTIRLWKTLAEDYPDLKVINRGFGGSEIVDSTHFADRLIFPHEPRQILLRAGGNDIHAGRTPRQVAADFEEFVRVVHARLPKAEILYISVSPAPSRWGESDKYRELNRLIREQALELPRVGFVDTFDMVLRPDGGARPELFVEDRLHFSPRGYELLRERVRPFLAR